MSQTQSAPSPRPVRLNLSLFKDMLERHCPSRLPQFETTRATLEDKNATLEARIEQLHELVCRPVRHEGLQGMDIYHWQGKEQPFALEIVHSFEPHPTKPTLTTTSEPDAMEELPPAPVEETTEQQAQASAPTPEGEPQAEPEPELSMPATSQGLFAALAELLGDSTLLMTVAHTGEEGKEPVLTVTVVPQGDGESFSPVCLEGTVSEFDNGFVGALQNKVESRKTFQEQIEALKAADKELEEAKKQEVEVKRKQADNKKKAIEKKVAKEETEKVEAANPEAFTPEPQKALF